MQFCQCPKVFLSLKAKRRNLKSMHPILLIRVLTQCGINVIDTYLVCLNSDNVRQGALDIQKPVAKPSSVTVSSAHGAMVKVWEKMEEVVE